MALYNDLDLPPLETEEIESLRSRVSNLETSLKTSEEECETLRDRTKISNETIAILERNMSSLFSTARLEIKRKDEELLRLRALLARERAIAFAKEEMLRNWLIELTRAGEQIQSSFSDVLMLDLDDGKKRFMSESLEKWWELARLPALAEAEAAAISTVGKPAVVSSSPSSESKPALPHMTTDSSQQYRQHQQTQPHQQRQQTYPQQHLGDRDRGGGGGGSRGGGGNGGGGGGGRGGGGDRDRGGAPPPPMMNSYDDRYRPHQQYQYHHHHQQQQQQQQQQPYQHNDGSRSRSPPDHIRR
jgi:uncharacterized membrane protein YgcG